jgi:hypothetical protein
MPTTYTITYDSTAAVLNLNTWYNSGTPVGNVSASKIILSANLDWDSTKQLIIIAKHAMVFDGKGNTLVIIGSNFEGLIQRKPWDPWVSQYPPPSTADGGPGENVGESYGLIVKNMIIDGTACNLNFSKASSYLFCGDYGSHGFPSSFTITGEFDGLPQHPYSKKGPGIDNSGNFSVAQSETNRIVFTCQIQSVEIKCKNDVDDLATIYKRDYESGVNGGPRVGAFFGAGVYGRVKMINCKANKSFSGYGATGYWEILNCFLDDDSGYGVILGDNINRHYEDWAWNGGWDSANAKLSLNRYIFKNCVFSDESQWSGTTYCYYPFHGASHTQGYSGLLDKSSRKPDYNTVFSTIEPYLMNSSGNMRSSVSTIQLASLGGGFEIINGIVEVLLSSEPKWKELTVMESTKIKNFPNEIIFTIMSSHDINIGEEILISGMSGSQTEDSTFLPLGGKDEIISYFNYSGVWTNVGTLKLTVYKLILKNTSLTFSIELKNETAQQDKIFPTVELIGINTIAEKAMTIGILSSSQNPGFSKFKIYESTIKQGATNTIKVIFRPDLEIPSGTQIDISGIENSNTQDGSLNINNITNNFLESIGIWERIKGKLTLTTTSNIPVTKDTIFTFDILNSNVSTDGFFVDISCSMIVENNPTLLEKISINKIMSCKTTTIFANYFLWFNYGGIITGPYSEEYSPIGTEGPGSDIGDFAREAYYYVNSQEGHQGTKWEDIYNGGTWPNIYLPAAYNNVVIGEKKYNQVNFQNMDTLGVVSAYDGYLDGEDNQNLFYGWSSRRIKSSDDAANFEGQRGTRLWEDNGNRDGADKTFPINGITYGKTGIETILGGNDTVSLSESKEFKKEYYIETDRLWNSHEGMQAHGNSSHKAKYLPNTTLPNNYQNKDLSGMGQTISFKFTLTRHPPEWESEKIKFTKREISESNNAQEAPNTITVRLKPTQNLLSGNIITITDLSGVLTPDGEIDISGAAFVNKGDWEKNVNNGKLKLTLKQTMSKNSVTEFSFVLVNRDTPQDKVKPSISIQELEAVEMVTEGILDASMSLIYMVDISDNEYRFQNIKNNVYEKELDFILTENSYKVKFDFTDKTITDSMSFIFDLSGPNFSGNLDHNLPNTIIKKYSDIVILDISKNTGDRGKSSDVNHGLSGGDIIIFTMQTPYVDSSGVIFINEEVSIDASPDGIDSDTAKVTLKVPYKVPENIKNRFVAPVTKKAKKENSLLRHRTIQNIFKSIPKNIEVFKTKPEDIGLDITLFKKTTIKVFKINSGEKNVAIVISEETDDETGFYVPLSSGESVSFQKNINSIPFDVIRTDVNNEARYSTKGIVSQTSGNYDILNYLEDNDYAVINGVGLYFGGVGEGKSPEEEEEEEKCVRLINCCSCDVKPIKKDESTLTTNFINTSRRVRWSRIAALNTKNAGRAISGIKCEPFLFNIKSNTKKPCIKEWNPYSKRWVLSKP